MIVWKASTSAKRLGTYVKEEAKLRTNLKRGQHVAVE